MVSLSDTYKSKCRFHLFGSGAGIPSLDRARLEEAMNGLADSITKGYIEGLIDQCDSSWNDIKTAQNTQIVAAETYAGDINRTVLRAQKSKEMVDYYYDIYFRHVDQLARRLWVPDYTTPNSDYYRYARWGGEYVNSLPGADGDDGESVYLTLNYA